MAPSSTPSPGAVEAKRFTRTRVIIAECRLVALVLLYFGLDLWYSDSLGAAARRIGFDTYYGTIAAFWTLFYLLIFLVAFPFSWWLYSVARRYGVLTLRWGAWVRQTLKNLALQWTFGLIASLGLYASIAHLKQMWWLGAWIVIGVLLLVRTVWLPILVLPLFVRITPLGQTPLRERLFACARRANVSIGGVFVMEISDKATVANAIVAGMGPWRRVMISDTLLQGYSDEEVEALIAHELGHIARHHLLKRTLVLLGIYFAAAWVLHGVAAAGVFITKPLTSATSMPELMVGFGACAVYGGFLTTWIARRQEEDADHFAWTHLDNVGAFVTAMRKLTVQNKIIYDKSQQWRYTHPATEERIKAAEAFIASIPTSVGASAPS
jgi:STE24 endopeptidase